MRDQRISDLLALLAAENAAIISARYTVLDDLAARKLHLFSDLPKAGPTRDELRQISMLLQKNESLLAAAIKGFAAARDRITALRAVREGLQVYDQSGQFATAVITRPDLLKKA
jgi:flagellar biosynthesis/type III secretory pathway chaperone